MHSKQSESNAKRFEVSAAATRAVVRVFPDFADSVIWYRGPVLYSISGLSEALILDMEEWESRYYARVDESEEFVSPEAELAHLTEGLDIARKLSEEIGDVLTVETDAMAGGKTRLLTPGPGTNPAARRYFARIIARAEVRDARVAAAVRSGTELAIALVQPSPDNGRPA